MVILDLEIINFDRVLQQLMLDFFDYDILAIDEDEDIAAEWIPEEKVFKMVNEGEIRDGKTLVALLWYKSERAAND